MRSSGPTTTDRTLELVQACDPLAGDDRRGGVEDALDELAVAITTRRRLVAARHGRRQRRSVTSKRLLALAAVLLSVGGGAAAATRLLTAHTGEYAKGWQVGAGGPGEYLRVGAPDFCQAALRLSRSVPYPPGFASWRPWVLVTELGVERVTTPGACESHERSSNQVSSGATRGFFAMSAFCAWVYDWRDAQRVDDRRSMRRAAGEIKRAPQWQAVRAEDQHLTASPVYQTGFGLQGEHSLFGWFLPFRDAVLRGDTSRVDALIDSNYGTAGCPYFKPPRASQGGTVNPLTAGS